MCSKVAISFIIILFISCNQGNYKILEKSGKQPKWVNGTDPNYIITYGMGETSEDAKNECLKNIRDQIISAVAINVRSKTEVNIDQRNGVTDEKFKYSIVSQSANIPSLQGISISKAVDSYWVKTMDKDRNIKFGYHLKYPFPKSELNRLMAEYAKMNEELDAQLNAGIKTADTATSFASIENAIMQLTNMQDAFIDYRKEKAQMALTTIYSMVDALNFVTVPNTNSGNFSFLIKNKGKSLKVNRKPDFKSNCAAFGDYFSKGTSNTITFSNDICKYTDNPKAILEYRLGSKKIQYEFLIDINSNKVDLVFSNDISIRKLKDSLGTIYLSECEFQLNSKFAYPFEIKRIEFKYQNIPPLIVDGLAIKINNKGVKNIKLNFNQQFDKSDYSSKNKAFPYFAANISFKNLNTGQDNTLKFSNLRYNTDW